jgi:hypothetical protein
VPYWFRIMSTDPFTITTSPAVVETPVADKGEKRKRKSIPGEGATDVDGDATMEPEAEGVPSKKQTISLASAMGSLGLLEGRSRSARHWVHLGDVREKCIISLRPVGLVKKVKDWSWNHVRTVLEKSCNFPLDIVKAISVVELPGEYQDALIEIHSEAFAALGTSLPAGRVCHHLGVYYAFSLPGSKVGRMSVSCEGGGLVPNQKALGKAMAVSNKY